MSIKYILDNQDQRDGGRHLVIVSIIDDATGLKVREPIASFEPQCKQAAETYVAWMNSRLASGEDVKP